MLLRLPVELQERIVATVDTPSRKALKAVNRAMRALATLPDDADTAMFIHNVVKESTFELVGAHVSYVRRPTDARLPETCALSSTSRQRAHPLSRHSAPDLIEVMRARLEDCRVEADAKARAEPYVVHIAARTMHVVCHSHIPTSLGNRLTIKVCALRGDSVPVNGVPSRLSEYKMHISYGRGLNERHGVRANYSSKGTLKHTIDLFGDHGNHYKYLLTLLLCAWSPPDGDMPTATAYSPNRQWPKQADGVKGVFVRCFGPDTVAFRF